MTNWLFVFYMHFTYIYKQLQQQTLYPREVKWLTRGQGLPQLPSSQSHIPGNLLGSHLLQGVLAPYLLHPASLPLQPWAQHFPLQPPMFLGLGCSLPFTPRRRGWAQEPRLGVGWGPAPHLASITHGGCGVDSSACHSPICRGDRGDGKKVFTAGIN